MPRNRALVRDFDAAPQKASIVSSLVIHAMRCAHDLSPPALVEVAFDHQRILSACRLNRVPFHCRLGERPRWLDRDRDLERPARRDEFRRPSHGSPGPEILICGIGAGGVPVVLSRALRHLRTGMRRSPCRGKNCQFNMSTREQK